MLFTILISPVQAKRPGPLDRPLPDYNNLTLRQIFEDGQLFLNPNLDTNTTGWTGISIGTPTVADGIASFTATAQFGRLTQSRGFVTQNKYYMISRFKSDSVSVKLVISGNVSASNIAHSGSNLFETKSAILTLTTDTSVGGGIYDYRSSAWTETQVDYVYFYNLTSLGIPTATKIEMDNLYSDYLKYKNMMNATDVMLIVGQLGAFVWSLLVSFEVFGFVLWEYALFGIGAGFIGYLALKIIQKKAGDDNGDSD